MVATPGHTSDSVSLLVTYADGSAADLLTGDTVLGFGSTVITHPDGDLGDFLASLDRLLALVAGRGVARILPGHGPVVGDPDGCLVGYRQHRLERLAQVRDALAAVRARRTRCWPPSTRLVRHPDRAAAAQA